MDTKVERIVLETGRHRIVGELTMPKEGFRSRISDFLNRGDLNFIPLANATIIELDTSTPVAPVSRDFIAVAADHVQIAYLDEG